METIGPFIHPPSEAQLREKEPVPHWLDYAKEKLKKKDEEMEEKGEGCIIELKYMESLLVDYKILEKYIINVSKGDLKVALQGLLQSIGDNRKELENIVENKQTSKINKFISLRRSLYSATVAVSLIITRFGGGGGGGAEISKVEMPPQLVSLKDNITVQTKVTGGKNEVFSVFNCHMITPLNEATKIVREDTGSVVLEKMKFDGSTVFPPPFGVTPENVPEATEEEVTSASGMYGKYIRAGNNDRAVYGSLAEAGTVIWVGRD